MALALTQVDIDVATLYNGAPESHTYRAWHTVQPLGTAVIQLSILPGDRGAEESTNISAARARPAPQ